MAENKRILKNSMFMAVRMLVTMGISLFTSRVVLQQLGVTDFGIYSVVGGLSMIVAFLTSSLTAAIQRYMNVELGQTGGKNMQRIFACCCVCVSLTALVVLLLAETAGLWFLNSKLSIPPGRMWDANVVYQLSLVIVLGEIFRVPYNSLIMAYEKMSFYAYNSIIEAALKLTVVTLLSWIAGDKLFIYMFLLIGVAVGITVSYVVYCRRRFREIHFSLKAPWRDTAEIGRFTGWNVLTSLSDIAYQQGSSMILNIFYGVAFNATMGITNQVKTAVFSFTRSVQYASNPQIVQMYSSGDHPGFVKLFMQTSRISAFLVLFIGLPLLINMNFVLDVWLADVPPQAARFARLMVIFCMVDSLTGPLWISMQAYGRIASYQIVVSCCWILCLPLTYVAYRNGMAPWALIEVMIAIDVVLIAVRAVYNKFCCRVGLWLYAKMVIVRLVAVAVAGSVLPVALSLVMDSPTAMFFATTALSCVTVPVAVYFLGCSAAEWLAVRNVLKKYLHSFR